MSILTSDPLMADIQEKAYKYTAAGDIDQITDTKGAQNITYDYGYDELHRLISEDNTGASDSFNFSILSKTFDDTAPLHAVKSVRLAGVDFTYAYDANGNMTTGWDFKDPTQVASRTITYTGDNMPKTIEHEYNGVITLKYDGDGTRVKKAVQGGGTTYYIGDHFEVANGIETKYIFGGNLRIAKVTSTNKYFFHKDHLGSSTVMTNHPGGVEIEAAEYLPFGLTRKQTGTEVTYYKFTDQEHDKETGLYNYNARLYDPAVGTFISPDSILQDPFDPQMLNRFTYAKNNPLKYTDPDGHFIFCAAAIAIGATYTGLMALGDLAVMGAIAYGISHQITVDKKIPNEELLAPPPKRGDAPIGKDGNPVELHHPDQQDTDKREELTRTDHRGKGNFKKNHPNVGQEPSKIDRKKSNKDRKGYWGKEIDRGRFDNYNFDDQSDSDQSDDSDQSGKDDSGETENGEE